MANPLKQIRILNIVLSPDLDESICSLEIVSHVTDPPKYYHALSYVWGDSSEKVPMKLIEDGKHFTVYITKNLRAAIRDLTLPSHGPERFASTQRHSPATSDNTDKFSHLGSPQVHIWIDALCIDQSNDRERSMQVQIMGEIYARSRGVRVWLGPIPGSGADLSEQQVGRLLHDGIKGQYSARKVLNDDSSYLAMSKLLLLPWWSRVWVVQEVIL